MTGIYLGIRNVVENLFTAGWSHADVPVLWRSNDLAPHPDPNAIWTPGATAAAHFLRNEVEFGPERLMSYGGGLGLNLRCQYGSVHIVGFAARGVAQEDTLLNLLADATALYRSVRTVDELNNAISFIGTGSGGDLQPTEDGNWFYRGMTAVFEYRFVG